MYSSTLSLTSTQDVVGVQLHAPAALPPGKRPGTHFTGDWMSPTSGLHRWGKCCPHRNSTTGPSSP